MAHLTEEQRSDLVSSVQQARQQLTDLEQRLFDQDDSSDVLNDAEEVQETVNAIVNRLEDING